MNYVIRCNRGEEFAWWSSSNKDWDHTKAGRWGSEAWTIRVYTSKKKAQKALEDLVYAPPGLEVVPITDEDLATIRSERRKRVTRGQQARFLVTEGVE